MSGASPYEDIIDMHHHVSETRAPMSMRERAAQFSPFAALSGYEDAVRESARMTQEKIELGEDAQEALDEALRRAAASPETEVAVTYFVPDEKKSGGRYVTAAGRVRRVDPVRGLLVLSGGERIGLEEILSIDEGDAWDLETRCGEE